MIRQHYCVFAFVNRAAGPSSRHKLFRAIIDHETISTIIGASFEHHELAHVESSQLDKWRHPENPGPGACIEIESTIQDDTIRFLVNMDCPHLVTNIFEFWRQNVRARVIWIKTCFNPNP